MGRKYDKRRKICTALSTALKGYSYVLVLLSRTPHYSPKFHNLPPLQNFHTSQLPSQSLHPHKNFSTAPGRESPATYLDLTGYVEVSLEEREENVFYVFCCGGFLDICPATEQEGCILSEEKEDR